MRRLTSDRAAIEKAKLDLSYCQIHSPISGRTGNLLVHAGNLVKANDVPLVVINQVSPIFISFGVPERQLTVIAAKLGSQKLPVVATFEDSNIKVHGTLTSIDNKVDPTTGTVRLKATFDNNEHLLWPGRFVNVVLTLDNQKATVIPSESVQAGQQGSFVYVVKPDKSVEPRPVVVGATVNGKVIVEKGVASGETVVTDGQSRLYPGATITTAQPAANVRRRERTMHFSRIFIERPIMTILVTFAILIFGIVGFRSLAVAQLPSVDYPTIQVSAGLPGASPETMASSVATPLEREIATIAGVQSLSSSNSQGGTTITAQFELSRSIDAATQDVQAAVLRAAMPSNMPHPPNVQRRIRHNSRSCTFRSLPIRCRCTPSQSTRRRRSPSAFPWSAEFRAFKSTVPKNTQFASRSIRMRWRPMESESMRFRRRFSQVIRIFRRAVCRRKTGLYGSIQRPVDECRRIPVHDCGIPQRYAHPARPTWKRPRFG